MSRHLLKVALSRQQTLLLSLHQCDLLCFPLASWLGEVFESHMHHGILTYEQMGQNSKKSMSGTAHHSLAHPTSLIFQIGFLASPLFSLLSFSLPLLLLFPSFPLPLTNIHTLFHQTTPTHIQTTHIQTTHITSHSYFISHIDQFSLLHPLDHF
jgi:hypothetical protein